MGLTVDARMKALGVGTPLLQTEFKSKAAEHNSSVEYCHGVYIKKNHII